MTPQRKCHAMASTLIVHHLAKAVPFYCKKITETDKQTSKSETSIIYFISKNTQSDEQLAGLLRAICNPLLVKSYIGFY